MTHEIANEWLAAEGCTSTVITILDQVFQRAAERSLLLNHPSTVSMTLWTMLRWEKKVARTALDRLGVDVRRLENGLDTILEQSDHGVFRHQDQVQQDLAHAHQEASGTIRDLVERAKQEAGKMQHTWIGTEHLLLAIIQMADPALSSILADSGITYKAAKDAIIKILKP